MSLSLIDVYHGNGPASIAAALDASAGAVVKASEGAQYQDPAHATTVATVRAAHKVVGHYHFGWLGSPIAPQVSNFLAAAKPIPGDTLWLDVEAEAGAGALQWPPSAAARVAAVVAFLAGVNAATRARCGIYANKSEWSALLGAATPLQKAALLAAPLWIAAPSDPAGHPAVSTPWVMHQYGIVGNIDRDYFAGDVTAWHALGVPVVTTGSGGQGTGVVTPPKPVGPSAHQLHVAHLAVLAARARAAAVAAAAKRHALHVAHLLHLRNHPKG